MRINPAPIHFNTEKDAENMRQLRSVTDHLPEGEAKSGQQESTIGICQCRRGKGEDEGTAMGSVLSTLAEIYAGGGAK